MEFLRMGVRGVRLHRGVPGVRYLNALNSSNKRPDSLERLALRIATLGALSLA
jgi:hypothetical protein